MGKEINVGMVQNWAELGNTRRAETCQRLGVFFEN
jgi:hypothetical protein